MSTTQHVQSLTRSVAALGVDLPEALAHTAGLLAEVLAAKPDSDDVRHAEVQKAAYALDATSESVLAAVEDAAEEAAGAAYSTRLREVATYALVQRFAEELRGAAGDELLLALRPGFEEKVVAPFAEATSLGLVGLTADTVLETGSPEAIQAYRTLPAAARHGDAVHRFLVSLVQDFHVLQSGEYSAFALTASFFASDAYRFRDTAVSFARAQGSPSRLGVWELGVGTLNTLSEARALAAEAEPVVASPVSVVVANVAYDEAGARLDREAGVTRVKLVSDADQALVGTLDEDGEVGI